MVRLNNQLPKCFSPLMGHHISTLLFPALFSPDLLLYLLDLPLLYHFVRLESYRVILLFPFPASFTRGFAF